MELISEVVSKVRTEEPFTILGAGPHWKFAYPRPYCSVSACITKY